MRLKEREMAETVNRKETRNTLIVSLNERKDYQDIVQKNLSFTQGTNRRFFKEKMISY